MGKNKKNNDLIPKVSLKKVTKQVKSKLSPLVQKLLNKCTNTNAVSRNGLDDYVEIYNLVQEIREHEKEYVVPFPERTDNWTDFQSWCSNNGAQLGTISIKEIEGNNFGIFAEEPLKENDLILSVPRKLMFTLENAKESELGPLINEDPMLRAMPNVVLSIYLIIEYLKDNSFWKPYFSILPSCYDTVLYYTIYELKHLEKSPALGQAVNLCRSVARQYAYFQLLFQNNAYANKLEISNYFTYDLYRWAVSTIMTRQNSVPLADGESLTMALVPLWDMCNHMNGKCSTDFDVENDCLKSYSMKDVEKEHEVYIFYGLRTNAEYFIHNGFVYTDNENDSFPLQLNISKNDPLIKEKSTMCLKKEIQISGKFDIRQNEPVSADLLTFLKINVLKKEDLLEVLDGDNILDFLDNNKELEQRALNFLRDRTDLLLKHYGSTIEDDEELLKTEISSHYRMAVQLRLSEKKLLFGCFKYCAATS